MKASKKKLQIIMARACMSVEDLEKKSEMPRPSLSNVMSGRNVRPETIGKVCRALGVDVTEILED